MRNHKKPAGLREFENNFIPKFQAIADQHLERMATCAYGCGAIQPSSKGKELTFFEKDKTHERCAHCGYGEEPHLNGRITKEECPHGFTPCKNRPVDTFYCGCRGWD